MTKIPVAYVYEEVWKVSENKGGKKMESEVPAWAWVLLGVALGLLLAVLSIPLFSPADNQAQCESIGGRYDGSQCWYNGSVIDVDKYVEEWK